MNLRVLTNAILDPGSLAAATLTDWDRLVRLARRARLLATLGVRIDEAGMRSVVPVAVLTALDSERVLADASSRTRGTIWSTVAARCTSMMPSPTSST